MNAEDFINHVIDKVDSRQRLDIIYSNFKKQESKD